MLSRLLLAGLVIAMVAPGCSKNILNLKPLDGVSDADLWSDPSLVVTFVNKRYDQIGHGQPESWMSSVSDETYMTWERGCAVVTQGNISPTNLGRFSVTGGYFGFDNRGWNTVWGNIKDCNLFFSKINTVPFGQDTALKNRYVGEVTFIRALMYFDLVSKWGGVPIITQVYGLDNLDAGAQLSRNTYSECVDFIEKQLDTAAMLLPATYGSTSNPNNGRATRVAALALKARMMLYAASPLMNQVGVDPLVGNTSPDPGRWQKVADADKAVIDLALANGYGLYNKYPDVKTNYSNMWLDKDNPEVLFSRQNYGGSSNAQYIDQANGPNGYDEWGGNTPTGEFVDDFENADGTKFSWATQGSNPYANRDARLYADVLVDGDIWKGRAVASHFTETTPGVFKGGVDTKDGPNPWNTSQTGYNMRKFLNPDFLVDSWVFAGASAQNWVWLRLGEFYLDYAEAQYNLGNEAEAKSSTYGVNVIRARAQMPAITQSGAALWSEIVNERRIELAFEEHRFFDVRRWMIADATVGRNATGVTVTVPLSGPKTFKVILTETRHFNGPSNYWLPIPQSEIAKNANLKQNPGYN